MHCINILEAENRIKQIEIKRQMLDEELRLARNKIRHSEESQQILEEKLMVNKCFCIQNKLIEFLLTFLLYFKGFVSKQSRR